MPLTKNMRIIPGQEQYARWILNMGNGLLPHPSPAHPKAIELLPEVILKNSKINPITKEQLPGTEDDLIKFGNGETIEPNQNRAILCPLNADSLQINEKILDRVAGEKITLSINSMEANEDDDELIQELSTEFVYSMTPPGLPPRLLNLKVGSIIMLLRNMTIRRGLCNGTRLKVLQLKINRSQFPVRLSYAMTVCIL